MALNPRRPTAKERKRLVLQPEADWAGYDREKFQSLTFHSPEPAVTASAIQKPMQNGETATM